MHTNRCVLIEISIEREIIDFLIGIIGHCTDGRKLLLSKNRRNSRYENFLQMLRCDEKTFHDIRI